MSITKILRVGHSNYVMIHHVLMERMQLETGDHVTVELTEKGLLIKPLKLEKEADHGRKD